MGNANRTDQGLRHGGEKGRYADEFITRSQLQQGRRITFEYASNYDIIIHAALDTYGGDANNIRMINGIITLSLTPHSASTIYTTAHYHGKLNAGAPYNEAKCFHFGSAKFNQIVHNWNLSDKDSFLVSTNKITFNNHEHNQILSGRAYTPKCYPRVAGIDNNTIILWGVEVGDLSLNLWKANNDTHLYNFGDIIQQWSYNTLQIHYTICEKVPPQGQLFIEPLGI